jgi:hypothetical protein
MSKLGKLGLRMRSCVPGVGAAANLGKGRGGGRGGVGRLLYLILHALRHGSGRDGLHAGVMSSVDEKTKVRIEARPVVPQLVMLCLRASQACPGRNGKRGLAGCVSAWLGWGRSRVGLMKSMMDDSMSSQVFGTSELIYT